MEILLQQIINGLVQGSVYALVALGYTMVYGILGLINFAHGEVVMIGAMLALSSLTVMLGWGVPPLLALLLSIVLAMVGLHGAWVTASNASPIARCAMRRVLLR